jgi:hypothetical protein
MHDDNNDRYAFEVDGRVAYNAVERKLWVSEKILLDNYYFPKLNSYHGL